MENKSFVFYSSFHDAIQFLPDEIQLQAYRAIVEYGLNGTISNENPYIKSILCVMMPNIDSAKMRYERARENGAKGKDFGVLGGRPTKVDPEKIKQLNQDGLTQQQISDELDISLRTVQRALRQNPT